MRLAITIAIILVVVVALVVLLGRWGLKSPPHDGAAPDDRREPPDA